MSNFTEAQKETFLAHLKAFLHAEVDGNIALIEAKRAADGKYVTVACIVQPITIPPRVLGGEATTADQLVPIFEFVDPSAPNPYVSEDKEVIDAAPSAIVLPGGANAGLRAAADAASNEAEPASAA